jgi:hypothetical protein
MGTATHTQTRQSLRYHHHYFIHVGHQCVCTPMQQTAVLRAARILPHMASANMTRGLCPKAALSSCTQQPGTCPLLTVVPASTKQMTHAASICYFTSCVHTASSHPEWLRAFAVVVLSEYAHRPNCLCTGPVQQEEKCKGLACTTGKEVKLGLNRCDRSHTHHGRLHTAMRSQQQGVKGASSFTALHVPQPCSSTSCRLKPHIHS